MRGCVGRVVAWRVRAALSWVAHIVSPAGAYRKVPRSIDVCQYGIWPPQPNLLLACVGNPIAKSGLMEANGRNL